MGARPQPHSLHMHWSNVAHGRIETAERQDTFRVLPDVSGSMRSTYALDRSHEASVECITHTRAAVADKLYLGSIVNAASNVVAKNSEFSLKIIGSSSLGHDQ